MFTPLNLDLERGWPGKIDGDRVIQVAAQTLQAFFTGGGNAREHAVYPLEDVRFLVPVWRPPSIRIFDGTDFHFGNPASLYGPEDEVPVPAEAERLEALLRPAAVIGALERIGGFTAMNDWQAPGLPGAKAGDFAISLGPFVVTPDELTPPGVDWAALVEHARRNTELLPGDVIGADAVQRVKVDRDSAVELELDGIGPLRNRIVQRAA
jgi:2-keto-4-pentenoate hydratase/2-oxohepta-3-ene-1,7-dioic acid hydratase in catechol pathway